MGVFQFLREYIFRKYFRLTKTSPFNSQARRGRGFPLAMHFNLNDPPGEILWSGLTEMKYGCRRRLPSPATPVPPRAVTVVSAEAASTSRRDRGLTEDLTSNLDIPLPITWMPCVTMHWYQPPSAD